MTVELDLDDISISYWNPAAETQHVNWNGHILTGSSALPKIAEKVPLPFSQPRLGYLSHNPKRDFVELKSKGEKIYENEGRVERASCQGNFKKFWKKHKKEILIGAGIAAAIVIVVVIVVATAGTAAVAGAGGSAVAGAAGAVTSSDKEKKIPPKGELPQQEPSFGERAKEFGAHLTHETWNGIAEVVSVIPQANEDIRKIGSKMIPKVVIYAAENPSPMENYERIVATGHQEIDRVFSTEQAIRYTPKAKANDPRNDFVIGVLPPPSNTISSVKETSKIGQKVARAAENFGNDRTMLESFEKFNNAKEFLKPYRGRYLSEIEARELIHQTGIKTFPRPAGIPENFIVKLSKKGAGMIYEHPEKSRISVRVMPGKPHSPNPSQQKPYVIQMIDDKALDKHGNLINHEFAEAHIPIDDFIYRN